MVIDTSRLLQAASNALAAGGQEVEGPGGIDITRLLAAVAEVSGKRGASITLKKDVGVVRAFGAGLEKGIKEPFRLLGVEPREVELDETSEQVANFLGAMVGLGISFVPFMAGTGIVLRSIGFTAKLAGAGATAIEVAQAARSQALFNFVRNTAAGTIQFAGTAEEISEVPKQAAIGAAFGAGIEGLFLLKAMRGRRGAVGKEKLVDTGNPNADVPVDIDRITAEIQVSPSVDKTTSQMTLELDGAFQQNKSWNEIVADLTDAHIETGLYTALSRKGAVDIVAYAKKNFPSPQVLSRETQAKGVHEVMIHQPFDPANVLTKQQLAEWNATGFASGERLIYGGTTVEATGGISPKLGFVSVRQPLSKGTRQGVPFLAPVEEVTRPMATRFFNKSAIRDQKLRDTVRSMDDRIGFVVPASTVAEGASLSARRGFADVAEFETATSFGEFAKQFKDELASVKASSPEEAVAILAAKRGIPGLRIVDDGVTTRVHVFDQGKVSFISEPPRVAKNLDGTTPVGVVTTGTGPPVTSIGPLPIIGLGKGKTARLPRPGEVTLEIASDIESGRLLPAVRADDGTIYARRQAAEHGDLMPAAEANGATFNNRAPSGWLTKDGVFVSTDDLQQVLAPGEGVFGKEIPNLGLVLDDVVMNQAGELTSFVPSWKNSISAPLREAGYPEKEIAQFLDLYAANTTRRLDSLMEPEFQAIKNASEIPFGGCP
ncbi:MAG: hypothetical protein QQN63_05040 [Nitrosopumilus sp.]